MVILTLKNGIKWSINNKFKKKLDIALDDMKHDEMDLIIPVTGKEGSGKSFDSRALGMYCATYLGSDFSSEDIEFDTRTYLNKSVKKPKFAINVLDEGRKVVGRSKGNQRETVLFLDFLSECRALQQVHIICVPAYHDLSGYIVHWRSGMIIQAMKNHVPDAKRESGFRLKRGEFRVYTDKKDLERYYDIKYDYPKKYFVRDWFCPTEVFTPEELKAYNDKKYAATVAKYGEGRKEKTPKEIEMNIRSRYVKRMIEEGLTAGQISEIIGVAESTVYNIRAQL